MIKNNEVTLHDSEEETTTAAPVFVGFDEEVHFSWEMEDDSNLCTDEFEVRRLDEEWIEEEWQMHVTRSAKKTRQKEKDWPEGDEWLIETSPTVADYSKRVHAQKTHLS